MNPEHKNPIGLSEDQKRYSFLTKEAGLGHEEALHAIGRRQGVFPEHRRLTQNERFRQRQAYLELGLNGEEIRRLLGASAETPSQTKVKRKKSVPTLDWMPAKKAYETSWPARSRKGLMK